MKGIICLWSGAIVDIPAGWSLCDGGGGRPDLRDRFVIGAGNTYAPDDSGGAVNHIHDFTGSGHAHDIPNTYDRPTTGAAVGLNGEVTLTGNATGATDSNGSLQPYYALAYIIKD